MKLVDNELSSCELFFTYKLQSKETKIKFLLFLINMRFTAQSNKIQSYVAYF